MGAFTRYILKKIMLILLYPLRVFPIKKNKVVLLNDIMNKDANFSSNPKYIALFLRKNYPGKFDIIYPLSKGASSNEVIENGFKVVKLKSIKYFYHVITCGFFITTSGGISYVPFRKSQIVINSWHGGGAYKKMALDYVDDDNLRKALRIAESKTDFFLSSNLYFSNAIQSAFLMPKNKILDFGLPRNDIFFKDNKCQIDKVKEFYSLNENSKIVLYAPTYRSAEESIFLKHTLGPYEIDYSGVLLALNERFGGDWVFAIRLHPSLVGSGIDLPKDVIDMTSYDDPQELMCAADVLINDFSSTMWDFVQTRKPCFIFATDLENYDSKLGFYTPPESWPFPLSMNNEKLFNNIVNFDNREYQAKVDSYFEWMNSYENGSSCEQLANLMCSVLDYGGKL
uniref:CDP-Glycerol:Poly(Glycerophosphate) glycerophosphotransferase n=1 Tax=Erysipelothrix rhusiopathiae TaxID=1648 RepID=A0A5A4PWS2_ERYRH|nr:CDP-Glycerol:Poly(glycerophosphate) glycerophosphotransferase [Erysipelothrix rhusiopathiae]BBG56751.1 CDP-Glycerol:Poly(glycerophosphate) glycerophosphotransferase [Erysipelothrix rhusiopathiae]BCD71111.1 CDP-glycerol:poly(glycerophosphate) glycerophosphotransferase [Erysipelothrix rhusiopathiae]